jgi:hypothetical protein
VQVAGHARLGQPWRSLPVREYALHEVAQALAAVEKGEVVKALVTP